MGLIKAQQWPFVNRREVTSLYEKRSVRAGRLYYWWWYYTLTQTYFIPPLKVVSISVWSHFEFICTIDHKKIDRGNHCIGAVTAVAPNKETHNTYLLHLINQFRNSDIKMRQVILWIDASRWREAIKSRETNRKTHQYLHSRHDND